jgi:hypothetical protein
MKNAVFWDIKTMKNGVTSQKKPFFIATAVKTSNLTYIKISSNLTGDTLLYLYKAQSVNAT